MSKLVCIHQPDFVPYLGFFRRLVDSDIFVVLDNVQFLRDGWHHRDKIKTPKGAEWFTLKCQYAPLRTLISDILLEPGTDWSTALLGKLAANYRAAAHFDTVFPVIEEILQGRHQRMIDLNMAFIDAGLKLFGIDIPMVRASALGINTIRTQRLIDICQRVGGDAYLSGTGALGYMEPEKFAEAGIRLKIQRFHPPVYPQLHGPFVPNLTFLDLWLNCGPQAVDILRGAPQTLADHVPEHTP